jgi:hypothetical protein
MITTWTIIDQLLFVKYMIISTIIKYLYKHNNRINKYKEIVIMIVTNWLN